jgi:putative ABC transport system permease protein
MACFKRDGLCFTDRFELFVLFGDAAGDEFAAEDFGHVAAEPCSFRPLAAGFQNGGDTSPRVDGLFSRASAGYFRTMGTSFVAGRDFDGHDNLSAPKVAIVNEEFAKKVFKGQNPVGRTFRREEDANKPDTLFQVVGLVRNTKYFELREDFRAIAFVASEQDDDQATDAEFTVLTTQLKESLMRDRLMATLAVPGLYGVIAYMVARRRNEIGVRMALGASRSGVIALILREALLLPGVGLAVGVALAAWAGQAAASLVYGLKPRDPVTPGGAAALLAVVALPASYGRAWQASRMQPMDALRDE